MNDIFSYCDTCGSCDLLWYLWFLCGASWKQGTEKGFGPRMMKQQQIPFWSQITDFDEGSCSVRCHWFYIFFFCLLLCILYLLFIFSYFSVKTIKHWQQTNWEAKWLKSLSVSQLLLGGTWRGEEEADQDLGLFTVQQLSSFRVSFSIKICSFILTLKGG